MQNNSVASNKFDSDGKLQSENTITWPSTSTCTKQSTLPTSNTFQQHFGKDKGENIEKNGVKLTQLKYFKKDRSNFYKVEANRIQSLNQDHKKENKKNIFCSLCKCELNFQCFSLGCFHFLCQPCLHNYIIEKVQKKERVMCPQKGCGISLNLQSVIFLSLPGEVQKKYKQLDLSKKYYSEREGIRISVAIHDQESQNNIPHSSEEKNPLAAELKYRTCKKCKKVCQKNASEFKIVCQICGYSYCYLCGKKWSRAEHCCEYIQALNRRNTNDTQPKEQQKKIQRTACQKCLFTPLLALAWVFIFILAIIPKFFVKAAIYSLISIVSGLTFYACAYIWNQQKTYKKILLLILYPLSLMIGVGMAFTIFFTTLLMQQVAFIKQIEGCLPSF